eukprot:scaffold34928_cov54-Attheya_sp.AAC.11
MIQIQIKTSHVYGRDVKYRCSKGTVEMNSGEMPSHDRLWLAKLKSNTNPGQVPDDSVILWLSVSWMEWVLSGFFHDI